MVQGWGSAGWMWCTEIVDSLLIWNDLDGEEGKDKRLEVLNSEINEVG